MPLLLLALLAQATQPLAGQLPPAAPDRPSNSATMSVEPVGMFVAACDANGDARTTAAELTACVARSFAGLSASGRAIGYIEYADWAKRWLGDANALPSPFEVDSNGDNQITLEELQARLAALFAQFDRNHDGAVSRDELLTIRSAGFGGGERPSGQQSRGGRGGGHHGGRRGGMGGGMGGGGMGD